MSISLLCQFSTGHAGLRGQFLARMRRAVLFILAAAALSVTEAFAAQYNVTLLSDPSVGVKTNFAIGSSSGPFPDNPPQTTTVTWRFLSGMEAGGPQPQGVDFLGWMENGVLVSTATRYSFLVTGNRTLVATFAVAGNSGNGTPWPDGVIPFVFDPDITPAHQQVMLNAMDHWAYYSGCHIAFVPWKGNSSSPGRSILRVQTLPPPANNASAGITGMPSVNQANPLKVSQSIWDANNPWQLDHELGHVLGLQHTHQRQDRDAHVTIEWNAMSVAFDPRASAQTSQWAVLRDSDCISGTYSGPYDVLSIMHYTADLFVTANPGEPNAAQFNSPTFPPSIQQSDLRHIQNVYGIDGESRFVDNTGSGGDQNGSISGPYRNLNTGAVFNAQRNDPGSRLWVAPGTYSYGATRISGPQKILPYPGGGPVRITP